MKDRSHLVRTPITDKSGKQTTVYRRPEAAAPGAASIPAPAVQSSTQAPQRDPEYAARLASVKAENEAWRGGDRSAAAGLKDPALQAISSLMFDVIDTRDKDGARDLAGILSVVLGDGGYSNVLLAQHFAPVFRDFAVMPDSEQPSMEWGDLDKALMREDYGPRDIIGVLHVATALQRLDLRSYTSGPEDDVERFCAHMWAHAHRKPDYDDRPDQIEGVVRLIDEHPDRVKGIAAAHGRGLHAAAILALIDGRVAPALSSGVL